MRFLTAGALLLALGASAWAMPPVPRPAPEFTIVDASGKQTLLSSYKGKVVMLMFVSTECPHCQRLVQVVSKLNNEFGPRGFQPVAVAFNPDVNPPMVSAFIKQFGVNFPVGFSAVNPVLSYLGFSVMERYVYPEVVMIDRKMTIRAQSPPQGDTKLQEPESLSKMIDELLKEGATTKSTSSTKKAPATPKKQG
jgi:thiol-disulfide isomerase/thioredoxin